MALEEIERDGNQLVIVVTKAQNLPNKKKLDKQSPYCVARIQDQIQKTKVVHRGGQNPEWDDELWFTLDELSGTTVVFSIYHQTKKDEELVCKADIDFSTVLKRSSKEGYDAWFPLEFDGRPAGRIYLQMTYYPSSNSVPTVVENAPRLIETKPKLNRPLPSLPRGAQPVEPEEPVLPVSESNDSLRESSWGGKVRWPSSRPQEKVRWPSTRDETRTASSNIIRPISRETPSMTQSVDCDGYLGQRFEIKPMRPIQNNQSDDDSSDSDTELGSPRRIQRPPPPPAHRVPLSPMTNSQRAPSEDKKGSWNILGSIFPSASADETPHTDAWNKRSAALGKEEETHSFHLPNPMGFLSGWRD